MAEANTQAYYDTANIAAIISFKWANCKTLFVTSPYDLGRSFSNNDKISAKIRSLVTLDLAGKLNYILRTTFLS
jgi:hypothetical protein